MSDCFERAYDVPNDIVREPVQPSADTAAVFDRLGRGLEWACPAVWALHRELTSLRPAPT